MTDPSPPSAPAPEAARGPEGAPQTRSMAGIAIVALVLVPIFWGYNWVVMKRAMAFMGAFEFATWRFVPSSLILLGAMVVTRRPLWIRPMWPVIVGGILQTAANTALLLWALRFGPAGRSALLCYTMPFWVLAFAWPLLGERPSRAQAIAVVAAAVGMALVFAAGMGSVRNLASVALAVISGLCWGAGTVIAKWLLARKRVDSLSLAAWQMFFGGIAVWAIALLVPGRPTQWTPYLVFALIWEILPATALAWILWVALLRRIDAGVASLAILAAPVIGLVGGFVELGERPKGMEAAGLVLILVALVLVGPLAVRQARRAPGS